MNVGRFMESGEGLIFSDGPEDIAGNGRGRTEDKPVGDALAFDRATVRTIDQDGRLHISVTPISKANVCPYFGKEIPKWQELGLEPERVYKMFRDPAELKKAEKTFNSLPLLSEHVPVSAADHKPELIVGATGSDAEFSAPYLKNSLVVWTKDAIEGIESGEQRELSSAYYFDPDMTPGHHDGKPYDGVMRNIVGNHVALVPVGRAGPDVMVGDSQIITTKKDHTMKLSKRAIQVKGALFAHLGPKIAADAAPDLAKALAEITNTNFATSKPSIVAALRPRLASDADLAALTDLLDHLDGEKPDGVPGMEPRDDDIARDDDGLGEHREKILEKLRGSAPDEILADIEKDLKDLCAASAAAKKTTEDDGEGDEGDGEDMPMIGDNPPPTPGTPAPPTPSAGAKKDDDRPTKAAMDAAIQRAKIDTEKATIAKLRNIGEAEKAVKPWIGELATAQDSAEAVYRLALDTLGVKTKGVHPSAYRAILEAQPRPADAPRGRSVLAADAGIDSDFRKKFPNYSAPRKA